ncbi:MAG TPA: ferredoxin [Bacteroidales bacterium]|nr:ferredoxin [Bacteroidales bacterium]
MLFTEESIRDYRIMEVAKAMMCAARTAPKARGIDNLVIATITNFDIIKLSEHTKKMYESNNQQFFLRDSENILKARAIVLIGTKISIVGLNCGLCGFATCEEKLSNSNVPCMFNSNDLGIAIGSAVSVAADNRIDSRVMYSVGVAAKELGLYGEEVAYGFAIPLSVTGKNPFFDRPTL